METFNLHKESDYNDLFVTLHDTGGEDVPQIGIGKDATGVFLVDLNPESGDVIRMKLYVTFGMKVLDVVQAGIKTGVFEQWAPDDIRMKTCDDLQAEWDEFYNLIVGPENKEEPVYDYEV